MAAVGFDVGSAGWGSFWSVVAGGRTFPLRAYRGGLSRGRCVGVSIFDLRVKEGRRGRRRQCGRRSGMGARRGSSSGVFGGRRRRLGRRRGGSEHLRGTGG